MLKIELWVDKWKKDERFTVTSPNPLEALEEFLDTFPRVGAGGETICMRLVEHVNEY